MVDVIGTGANDILVGTNDNDTLNGLVGADTMAGGDGSDLYFVDQAGDVVTELATRASTDRVVSTVSTTLAANAEILELVGGALNGNGNKQENRPARQQLRQHPGRRRRR
jgi:Ca2+-binding RTX toxin-like protein